MMDSQSEAALESCSYLLSQAHREGARIKILIGNGCHWLPLIKPEHMPLYIALFRAAQRNMSVTSEEFRRIYSDSQHRQRLIDKYRTEVDATLADLAKDKNLVDSRVWLHYERWRRPTLVSPLHQSPVYSILFYLVERRLVDTMITTNYDSILSTVYTNLSRLRRAPIINPLLSDDEWDEDGYYSYKTSSTPVLWKVHGTLDHIRFDCCDCLHHLPPQRIARRPHRHSAGGTIHYAKHFHDYNYTPRSEHFLPLIDAAVRELQSSVDDGTGFILVLGYRGETGDSDRLTQTLKELAQAAKPPVYLILGTHRPVAELDPDENPLWHYLSGHGTVIQNRIDEGGIADVLVRLLQGSTLGTDFDSWSMQFEGDLAAEEEVP